MNYEEWRKLKSIRDEDTKGVIRSFELSNPGLTALYERRQAEETEKMRQAMTIDDRMARWQKIAKLNHDPDFAARRRREEM